MVSAGASVTDLLIDLGAETQIVGIDATSQLNNKDVPNIGYHRQLSVEGVLSLSPTLLLGSEEMGPKPVLTKLNNAGVKVVALPSAPTVAALKQRITQVANLTDKQSKAAPLLRAVDGKLTQLKRRAPASTQQGVFLLVHQGRPASIAGTSTTPNTLIELIGATNPAANTVTSYKPLSPEALLGFNPDFILVMQRSLDQLGGLTGLANAVPLLENTQAFQQNKILAIDGSVLVGGLSLKSLDEALRVQSQLIELSQ
ncbi:hemin ABC transporter substrate-binding protein [Salinivibrio sp. VYel9]|nr:hemin ABC transporter substrate-binding protein [Salinivibrio sp. VYel7]MPX93091.1 hemin ABC transporter substrate-binding protein [Salinivibrio sp. VYel9]MPX95225.1 hemin ABC transporter substrate-binding protein [Salinivibrio sp. VYel6]MPX99309.1 hemin ABC transporter substrate-binding protein [Salinivibrio sp. VYel4]MPY01984.1 hemin ABC transporter substrate-binding protein [Salinivibrio sp. VYel5]MPY05277.1 hemin ABC transporter substrate-binding protein [Salinivibrio sp. VYel8]MPY1250